MTTPSTRTTGTQVSDRPTWVEILLDRNLSPAEGRVATYLVWRQGHNSSAWPSQATIASDLGLTPDAIRKITRRLEEKGWLRIVRPTHTAPGQYIKYQVTIPEHPDDWLGEHPDDGSGVFQNTQTAGWVNTQTAVRNNTYKEHIQKSIGPSSVATTQVGRRGGRGFVNTPPTVEAVRAYAASVGYPDFDAKRFVEYYEAAEWHDAKGNPVRNWKQKLLSVWTKKSPSQEASREPEPRGEDWYPTEDDVAKVLAQGGRLDGHSN